MKRFSKFIEAITFGMLLLCSSGQCANTQRDKDPHRPACASAPCRRIQAFLRAHYCGDSPFGNGPDDGCDIRDRSRHGKDVDVQADYTCKWDESSAKSTCKQQGQPTAELRNIVLEEMHGLGLSANRDRDVYFTIWKTKRGGWTLAQGIYDKSTGTVLRICQATLIIGDGLQPIVLRRLPFQRTDADVPTVTTWSPVDLADVDGDGRIEVVLRADAYENHWLEVDSVLDGVARKIFSGLGYYL